MIDPKSLCDLEAERAVIGAAMIEPSAADECLALLRAESFYRESHRRIWASVGRLRGKGLGCETLTLADDLQAAGNLDAAGGLSYLSDLEAGSATTANASHYARLVLEAHARREARRGADLVRDRAQDPTADLAAVREAAEEMRRAVADCAPTGPAQLSTMVQPAYLSVERIYDGAEEPGIPTGLPMMDRWLGGLHRGELTLLGGRPSVGKSSLAQEIATRVAADGGCVLFASAEMDGRTVALRALSARARVDGRKFRGEPRMEKDDWTRVSKALASLTEIGKRLWVDDRSRTMADIAAQARRLHAREPLTLLVVDHLQHLRSPKDADNRTQAIGRMAQECKDLATGLGIAVLALSQLNRQAPGGERKPRLHDLRESGELEQIADVVLLLHRPGDEAPPPLCEVECAVAKHRNGEVGAFSLWHERATGCWYDASQRPRAVGRDAR